MSVPPSTRPERSRNPSTEVHGGVDRVNADGIGIGCPESTSPRTPRPLEKSTPPSVKRGSARSPQGNRREDTWTQCGHRHGRHTAPPVARHLLRAMASTIPQETGWAIAGPFTVMRFHKAQLSTGFGSAWRCSAMNGSEHRMRHLIELRQDLILRSAKRVSKDGPQARCLFTSFETRPVGAPQDEAVSLRFSVKQRGSNLARSKVMACAMVRKPRRIGYSP